MNFIFQNFTKDIQNFKDVPFYIGLLIQILKFFKLGEVFFFFFADGFCSHFLGQWLYQSFQKLRGASYTPTALSSLVVGPRFKSAVICSTVRMVLNMNSRVQRA